MNDKTLSLFSLGEDLSPDELKSGYVKVEEVAHGNPAFAFSMVVNNEYLAIPIQAADGHMHADEPKLLASFLGPLNDNGNPMVQLFCLGMIKDIAADAWLKDFLNREGTTLVEMKTHNPLHAEAVVTRVTEEEVKLGVRLDVQIHGNRLFMIQCTAPEDLLGEYLDSFGVSIATFKPLHAMAQPSVEVRSNYRMDEALFFQMPYSWPFTKLEAPKGMDGFSFLNLNAESEPAGAIKVFSLRRSLTDGKEDLDLPALMVSEFTKTGLQITDVVSEHNIPTPPPFTGGSTKVLLAKTSQDSSPVLNLVVAAVDSPDHHILVGLLTCAPKEDFYLHSVNMRAFEIVLETLQVGDPS